MRNSVFLLLAVVGPVPNAVLPPAAPPLSTYVMGEKVQLGHLNYTVFETQWLTQLGEGANSPGAAEPLFPGPHERGERRQRRRGGPQSDHPGRPRHGLRGTQQRRRRAAVGGYLRTAKPADSIQGNMFSTRRPVTTS